jgi:hypothetical protein
MKNKIILKEAQLIDIIERTVNKIKEEKKINETTNKVLSVLREDSKSNKSTLKKTFNFSQLTKGDKIKDKKTKDILTVKFCGSDSATVHNETTGKSFEIDSLSKYEPVKIKNLQENKISETLGKVFRILNENTKHPVNDMLIAYMEACLFTEEDNTIESGKSIDDFSKQFKQKAFKDIVAFYSKAKKEASEELETYSASDLGHNFWLSRNGHGAGFFDDDNDKLQEIAKSFGEVYCYCGDEDGKIYC